jgi:SAM-dependent methyltransferase
VLELACGPGTWTPQLLRHAATVTAVDAAPEMLAEARGRVGADDRVRFVQADLFAYRPERRYDVVFFGFWLSHVPLERFDAFWSMVAEALAPGGRVFFVDDAYRTPDELIEGADSSTIRRRTSYGAGHRIVKVPHTPAGLETRLRRLGWDVRVTATSHVFFWGEGYKSGSG